MGRPTPQQAQQRRAIVEAALRRETPIRRGPNWELYRSNNGYYAIRYRETGVLYLGISEATGEVKDLSGEALERADISIALRCFSVSGLTAMLTLIQNWARINHGWG